MSQTQLYRAVPCTGCQGKGTVVRRDFFSGNLHRETCGTCGGSGKLFIKVGHQDLKLVEYFDRLPGPIRDQLREIIGTGELGWKSAWEKLSAAKKLKVGEVTFGKAVQNVRLEFEHNVSTGYDIPVIIAEEP